MQKLKREDRDHGEGPPNKCSKKNEKKKLTDTITPPKATNFKGYDLTDLPLEALPLFNHEYKGRHSYTVNLGGAVSWIVFESQSVCLISHWTVKTSSS